MAGASAAGDEPPFEGLGLPSLEQYLDRIAAEGLGWTVAVLMGLIAGTLGVVLYRTLTKRLKDADATIDRLATVIANNTHSNDKVAELVKDAIALLPRRRP